MALRQLSPLQNYIRSIARHHELEALNDAQLLQAFVEGNPDAIAELTKKHYALVMSACLSVFRDFSEAEEVFVAALIVLMEKANSKWQPSVGAWLYGTAWHLAKQKKANYTRQRKCEEALKMVKPESAPANDLSELYKILHEELAKLHERYRSPVVLCHLEGKTRDEAAKELGLHLRTLDRRKEEGLKLLRTRLMRRGYMLSVGLLVAALAQQATEAKTTPFLMKSIAAQAATAFAALRGSSDGALSKAAVLAKAFLANSTMAKWKGLLISTCAHFFKAMRLGPSRRAATAGTGG